MGGPLSFLFGLGLVGAGAMQDAAKKEEMRQYNERKKELNYMPENRKFILEDRFSKNHAWTSPGGISKKKLRKKFEEYYGAKMTPIDEVLTLMNYFVNNFTSYNYNSMPNTFHTGVGRVLKFDFDEVKVKGWGTRVEFDPTVEELWVRDHHLGSWKHVRKENYNKDDYERAQWIAYYIASRYDEEDRDQWVLVYEWFNKKQPAWLEGRARCYYRIIQEHELVDGIKAYYARVYGEDHEPYIFYGEGYADFCSKDACLKLEDVKVDKRSVR